MAVGLTDVQMDLLFVYPVSLVIGYFFTRLLDMRHPGAFMAAVAASAFALNLVRSDFTPAVKLASGFVFDVALPIALSRGPLSRRVLTVFLVQIAVAADEIVGTAVWLLLADAPSADYSAARDHFGVFVFMHVVHMVVLVALLMLLESALRRKGRALDGVPLRLFAGLPATQFALMIAAVFLGFYCFNDSFWYYAACSALMVLFLAVDVLFLRALRAHAAAQAEKARLAAVEERLRSYYAHCARTVESAERVAKFRHDARNQLQVVRSLAERGEAGAARDHALALRDALAAEAEADNG